MWLPEQFPFAAGATMQPLVQSFKHKTDRTLVSSPKVRRNCIHNLQFGSFAPAQLSNGHCCFLNHQLLTDNCMHPCCFVPRVFPCTECWLPQRLMLLSCRLHAAWLRCATSLTWLWTCSAPSTAIAAQRSSWQQPSPRYVTHVQRPLHVGCCVNKVCCVCTAA